LGSAFADVYDDAKQSWVDRSAERKQYNRDGTIAPFTPEKLEQEARVRNLRQAVISKNFEALKSEVNGNVSKQKLEAIITDLSHSNKWYQNAVRLEALSLYSHTNRRLVWALVGGLKLVTDPKDCSEILTALQWLKNRKPTRPMTQVFSKK
jgi:hypothetical protein